MFWHGAVNSNAIDNLLNQPDVTLTTILDQDEVLSEIRAQNKKLLEFLTRKESMCEMLDLITTVPSSEIPMTLQYKFPNTACEVLTSDISFAEKIAAEQVMMEKLFHFFRDAEPPLNPLLASYVSRVLEKMIARKLDQNWYSYQLNLIQVMGYLQSEQNLLDWLMKHVETSSVCDFFHKLVMNVEGQEMRASLYEWLERKENFIMKLVNSMDRLHTKDAHMNICRLFGDLLFALQDETSSPSQDRIDNEPFLVALKSHTTFERLLDVIFGDDTLSQSSIVFGLEMVLALLGVAKKPGKQNMKVDLMYETNEDICIPAPIRATLMEKMSTLLRFLQSPLGERRTLCLSNGVLDEPLGLERLAIVKFIAHIITLHDVEINDTLIKSGVLQKTLDLFWDHPWNNFLHHFVCQIVIQMSKFTRSSNCATFLFIEYAFPEKVMEAFANEELKAGYFGHLAKMAAALNDSLETNETIKTILPEFDKAKPDVRAAFKDFYDGKWKEYNDKASQLLAGAALPTAGVTMTSTQHNYESDPGVTWEESSGLGLSSDNDNSDFFEPSTSASYGSTDRYDDEKSKTIFEMFCLDRSNSAEDDDDDAAFNRNEDGMTFDADHAGDNENHDFEWRDPSIFLKQLEEQEEMFGQLALNGSLGNDSLVGDSSLSASSFISNPWAGQESVQVNTADPWAAFDFSDNNTTTTASQDDNWAKFDQSFLNSPDTIASSGGGGVVDTGFANFSEVPDLFPASSSGETAFPPASESETDASVGTESKEESTAIVPPTPASSLTSLSEKQNEV